MIPDHVRGRLFGIMLARLAASKNGKSMTGRTDSDYRSIADEYFAIKTAWWDRQGDVKFP
jgi:hypothetical protein